MRTAKRPRHLIHASPLLEAPTDLLSLSNLRTSAATGLLSGAIGASFMTAIFVVLRLFHLTDINWEIGLGSTLTHSLSLETWVIGFALHLAHGALTGLLLVWLLKKLEWGGPVEGAVLGFAYWFVVSIVIGALPALDTLTAPGTSPAGPFGVFHGQFAFYSLLIVHLAFGAIIGWAIGEPLGSPSHGRYESRLFSRSSFNQQRRSNP